MNTNPTASASRPHEPRLARASSVTSGEGQAVRAPGTSSQRQRPMVVRQERQSLAGQLLRHNLVSPEKKTLKRIDALRKPLLTGRDDHGVAVDVDSTGARIHDLLRVDRGLAGAVSDEAFVTLAGRLLDPARLSLTAATLIGSFLRDHGGIERGSATPERVKAALAALSDALYDIDSPNSPIPTHVRDLRTEKRDGGLQIVAILRTMGNDDEALGALRVELRRAGYADIDVRTERLGDAAHRHAST